MADIVLDLPDDRFEGGTGKINEDINKLKSAAATTADLASQALADINAELDALQATIKAQAAAITTLQGGTVTAPTGKSDLTVTSISVSPANPNEGDFVVFSATVKNVGTAASDPSSPVIVTFVVDSNSSLTSRTASYALPIAVGDSVTLSASGGANGANAYRAVKGDHAVVGTVNDAVNGGYNAVDNNSLSARFTVTGVTNGGPTTTPPANTTSYDSNGLAFTALSVAQSSITDQDTVQVSETIAYDPSRTTATTLEYGFSVRQVDTSGTVISPDDASLDMSLQAFQSTDSWTNKLNTITASKVYPAGRYSITPFYRIQGTSTYVKANALTKYITVSSTVTTPAPGGGGTTPTTSGVSWLSGSSGEMTASGKFGTWRGHKDDMAVHWNQNVTSWPALNAGGEYGNWTGDMEICIGGDFGKTWSQSASGANDANYTAQLNALKSQWTRIQRGTLYISFAHEMNGDWFDWSVRSAGDQQQFANTVKRFAGLKKSIFPQAKLGLIVNKDSKYGLDWRRNVPGVIEGTPASQWLEWGGVDWYNQYQPIANSSQVAAEFNRVDGTGAPVGIEKHRQFWQSQGLPFGVQEWGGNADNGDYTAYIQAMFDLFKANAPADKHAPQAGQIAFETYFNTLVSAQAYRFFLYNDGRATRLPNSAALYKSLWSTLK